MDIPLNETTFVRLNKTGIEIFERTEGDGIILSDSSVRKLMTILENEYEFPEESDPA